MPAWHKSIFISSAVAADGRETARKTACRDRDQPSGRSSPPFATYSSDFFALAVRSVTVQEISRVNLRAFCAMSEVFNSPLLSVVV